MKKTSLLFSLLAVSMLGSLIGVNKVADAKADGEGNGLVYSLDFEDSTNLGKNNASTIADAVVHSSGDRVKQIVRKENEHGIYLEGGTSFENYLDLPTDMFTGTSCTIAGWFYHPSAQTESYQGEIGIYSPENDKSFRSDQYAQYHNNCYLYVFGNTQCFNSNVFPVYDAWYHMAYTIENSTVKVHQNGKLVKTFEGTNLSDLSLFNSATSHFYLGQSAYETNHGDYVGGFDDIRVYNKALSINEIVSEYNLKNTDFLLDEYTFDSETNMLQDNIRGYTLSTHDADATGAGTHNDPVYDNGSMYLNDSTVILAKQSDAFGAPVNPNMLFGLSECTFNFDLKVSENSNFDWVRIFDIFVKDSQKMTFMSHTGGVGTSMNIVIDGGQWVLDGQTAYTLNPNRWYNISVVMTVNSIKMYVNGAKICDIAIASDLMSKIYEFVSSNNSWFTLGAPVYEGNRFISAWYDNIRIYGTSLNDNEMLEIAGKSRIYRTITIDGEEHIAFDGEPYELQQLSKDGYSFIGYQDEAGNTYTEELPANTGDIKLTSIFEKMKGSITFVANGATGTMDPIEVTTAEITLPTCTFVKIGYDFMGWSTKEGGDVIFSDGATLLGVSEEITLYAVFQARTYTITFNANGGQGEMETMSHTVDQKANLAKNAFTRIGYTFAGWSLTETGLAEFVDEQEIAIIGVGQDVTLYAVWNLNTVVISFNANGGTGEMESITTDALNFVNLPACTFIKEGYEFIGWATTANGEVVYANEELVEFAESIELFAIYSKTEEPEPVEPDDPTDPTEPEGEKENKKGCRGNIIATSTIICVIALVGSVLLFRRKKQF